MIPKIHSYISSLSISSIPEDRKVKLQALIDYMNEKIELQKNIKLNFICTHNSRRSQFAQIWAQTMAAYFGVPLESFSGGVEVTEFNRNAISALTDVGFDIHKKGDENPHYMVNYSEDFPPLEMFSKIYDDPINSIDQFAAVMTCSDADANCPVILGAEKRIPLTYDDPKIYDGKENQDRKYKETSRLIATELYYVFFNLKTQ